MDGTASRRAERAIDGAAQRLDARADQPEDPDDLAAHFGPGYALSSITLAITDEPVTKGRVEAVLGWLEAYENKQLDGDRYTKLSAPNRFANSLNRLEFQRGL